jgi:hypothetical protein
MYKFVYSTVKEVLISYDGLSTPFHELHVILSDLLRVNNFKLHMTGYGYILVLWLILVPGGL